VAGAGRQDVGLDRADEDRVGGLLGDEALEAAVARSPLGLDDLRRGGGRVADGADLALAHEVGERAERLLDVGVGGWAVDLVQVDPVGVQAPQRVLDRAEYPAARAALRLRSSPIAPWNFVARTTSSRRPASALPTISSDPPAAVDVGGVDHVDPGVERGVDDAQRLAVVGVAPRPEHHRPAGAPEEAMFHRARPDPQRPPSLRATLAGSSWRVAGQLPSRLRVGGEDVEPAVADERRRAGDRVEDVLDARPDGLLRPAPARGGDARLRRAGEVEQVRALGVSSRSARASACSTLSDAPLMSPRSIRV
jgi:hypothetical protein